MADEAKLLVLLKQARTALKCDLPKEALQCIREAIELIEPKRR